MKRYIALGFLLGFLTGPFVVVYSFGKYTEFRVHEMDVQAAEEENRTHMMAQIYQRNVEVQKRKEQADAKMRFLTDQDAQVSK